MANAGSGAFFFGRLPINGDELPARDSRFNVPIMITHYVDKSGIDYIFISRWWLQTNEQAMTTRPYEPWDTRLTVYGMRNYIHLHPSTIEYWRGWRDEALHLELDEVERSDVGLSWAAADIQLLNAVCKTPAHFSET